MSKFIIRVFDKETWRELKFTSFAKPVDDSHSVSFTDRDNLFRSFPKELFAIQIEEVVE